MPRNVFACREGVGIVLWAVRWKKARRGNHFNELVIVIMLGQLRKMHALQLDVPYGALFRSILTNVPKKNGAGLLPLPVSDAPLDNTCYIGVSYFFYPTGRNILPCLTPSPINVMSYCVSTSPKNGEEATAAVARAEQHLESVVCKKQLKKQNNINITYVRVHQHVVYYLCCWTHICWNPVYADFAADGACSLNSVRICSCILRSIQQYTATPPVSTLVLQHRRYNLPPGVSGYTKRMFPKPHTSTPISDA